MIQFRFPNILTLPEIEGQLQTRDIYAFDATGWSAEAQREGIGFDLSHVEYADFTALTQIAQLAEGAARRGVRVWIATPLRTMRAAERRYLDELSGDETADRRERDRLMARAARRRSTSRFMAHCGFIDAMQPPHVPRVDELIKISPDHDSSLGNSAADEAEDTAANLLGPLPDQDGMSDVRVIVPLRWLASAQGSEPRSWESEIERMLALRAPMLTTDDVDVLVTIVIRELVENAMSHARETSGYRCAPAALLGAIVLPSDWWSLPYAFDDEIVERYRRSLVRREGPLIRIVVADSGLGITATLKAPSPKSRNVDLPKLGRVLDEGERSLLWSMSPWSSGGRRNEVERYGVRGLASVRRVVRESAGTILLRSGDAVAGMVYADGARIAVSEGKLASVPGTLVEILIAPSAEFPTQRRESLTAARKVDAAAVVELRWRADGSVDKNHLLRALRSSTVATRADQVTFLCVKADIPTDGAASATFLSEVLQLAEEVADSPALVVILCLGQSAVEIEPRVRSFDDLRLRSGEVAGVAVMIMDRQAKTRWLGVDRRQSAILSALVRGPSRTMSQDDLARAISTSRAAVSDRLRRMSNWVGADKHEAWLLARPEEIDEAIQRSVQRRARGLAGARKTAGASEICATPTLALVSMSSDERKLLADFGGDQLGGFVLGRYVNTLLKQELRADLSIACVGRFPERTLESFRAALGVTATPVIFPGEAGLYDDPEIPFIRARGKVLLLTAMIVTAERVRHAANDLIRAGALPIGVACLLDGRLNPEHLNVLGNKLSVHSLVRSRLVIERSDRAPKAIDPVQIPDGSRSVRLEPDYPIARETILSWCERTPGSLLTGHIARHSRRHFFSFLDPAPLLGKESVRTLIARSAGALVTQWLHDTAAKDRVRNVVVLYVGEENGVAGDLARLFAGTIDDAGDGPLLIGAYGLGQALMGDRWVTLPPELDLPPKTAALVVDWGAVTSHTIHGLIIAAGQIGADSILALTLTSQLDPVEEVLTRSIRAVAGRRPATAGVVGQDRENGDPALVEDDHAGNRAVPVDIKFMSSFPVGYSHAWECLPCQYAREYMEVADQGYSDVIERAARNAAERLAPRELAEYRRDGPVDAFGMQVSATEAVQLARLRGRLEDARLSTAARLAMKAEISGMSSTELDALVRLLALEPGLLKRAPIRHRSMRTALHAKIAARLDREPAQGMEVDLRRQYMLTIRTIAKQDYVSHFRQWLVEAVQRPETIPAAQDLLLGIHTLVTRPYHRSMQDAEYAEIALSGALDDIRNDPALMRESAALSIAATLIDLLARTRYNSLTAAAVPSAQSAWASLRENYFTPVMEHTVDARMSAVQVAVQLNRTRTPEQWQSTLRAWQTTQEFLINRVLPLLQPIKGIVLARLYHRGSAEDIERWRVACTRDVLTELQKITSLLVRFVNDPEYALVRTDEVRRLVGWWHRFFFAKPSLQVESEGDGLLAALTDCPCRIGDAIQDAIAHGIESAESLQRPLADPQTAGAMEQEVFCNKRMVTEVIQHLFENAIDVRHAADPDSTRPVSVRIEVHAAEHQLEIKVMNDGTRTSEPVGRGMAYFDRYVRNYGGSLSGRALDDAPPWTYEARLRLQRYRPIYPIT